MPDRTVVAVTGTGAVVFDDTDRGDIVLRTATGRFHHLVDPPAGVVAHLAGTTAAEPSRTASEVDDYIGRLRAEITYREQTDAQTRWPDDRRDVGVIGSGAVASDIAEALTQIGVRIQRHDRADALDPAAVALVVAVADGPTEWGALDELPRRGVAWLRAYREGSVWFVDPIATSSDDPSARQVARRRLAASPVPRHVRAWRQRTRPDPPDLTVVERIRVADRILGVALAWAQDDPLLDVHRRTLWTYVSATGRTREHPVLSYPAPADSETAATGTAQR
ncbi:hypothetical protein [Gordonia sp. (in: high G+C Gram-positive bacteria)]|uniref:hypothetical protein n=1 Tax=Gordonia sp. (in: high G+C Gram-positive bacteria) TaxID=84139 RepID=UPI003F98FFEC